jgi:thiamine-phosphate pyrophosphorylase
MSRFHRKMHGAAPRLWRKMRGALPRLWLFSDERVDTDTLFTAIKRLPRGSGIIFRHYSLAPEDRRALYARVRALARCRHLVLLLADCPQMALQWRADGWHGREKARIGFQRPLIHTAPVHSISELHGAVRAGADLLFLSPVFQTRSHPGGKTLGLKGLSRLIRHTDKPVIALGGMTRRRASAAKAVGAYGWAAIDGLSPAPKSTIKT